MSNAFTPKLGRIGWKHGIRLDRYINKVMHAAHAAGHVRGKSSSGFTGARIGRGNAFGTLAGAGLYAGQQRRAIVKARIVKLKSGDLGAARAHLRYIQRDGVTQEGEPGLLYGPDSDDANGTSFLDQSKEDRHQFRLIVSPEDGEQLADLKPFIRDLMTKVEDDLGTRLDWVAVDHFNTGHPHTHIIIRGKDDRGQDLIIAKDYVAHGFRTRARDLLSLELGPEIDGDLTLKLAGDVSAERFTRLDRSLLHHTDRGFLVVSAMPPEERTSHAAYMGRLRKLEDLGLTQERQTGVWEVSSDLEVRLRSLGQRGDIIKTMHRALREARIDRPGGNYAVFDATKSGNRIVGRVAGIGLADEINDRHYLVLDGIDGKVHYADVGHLNPEVVPEKGMIVSVEAAQNETQARTRLRVLSYINLERLAESEGATWLDRQILSSTPERNVDQGFGQQVRTALTRRQSWLVVQELAERQEDGGLKPVPNLVATLRQREIRQAANLLAKELGASFAYMPEDGKVSGTLVKPAILASGKFAVLQRAKEFTLVPWQPQMERYIGKVVSGSANGQGISWDWGLKRSQGLGI